MVWSDQAWHTVSKVISEAYLKTHGIKNLRQLTKADTSTIERLKLDVFTNLEINKEVNPSIIISLLKSNVSAPKSFKDLLKKNNVSPDEMPIDLYRKNVVGFFVSENARS